MKSILLSRTFWLGVGIFAVGALQQTGATSALPAPWGNLATEAAGALLIYLRRVTTVPVTFTAPIVPPSVP